MSANIEHQQNLINETTTATESANTTTDATANAAATLDASNEQSSETPAMRILYAYVNSEDDEDDENDDVQSVSTTTTIAWIIEPPIVNGRRWFILEIPVFLVFVASFLTNAVFQNQVLYHSCITVFHYNSTECKPLLGVEKETAETQSIEAEVQRYVVNIFAVRSLLESIIPALVSLFIGPWSDKYGRRPIILTTFTGYMISYIILTVLSYISTEIVFSPWLYLLSSVPSVLSGGTCALITGIYCYISDVSRERARAFRMVLNEAAIYAGIMVGTTCSSFIYAATNVVTMFSISTLLMLCALFYAYYFVTESVDIRHNVGESKLREFFRFDLVKDSIYTCYKRRPNFDRAIIWLSIAGLVLEIFVLDGESNVMYLFLRVKFDWTLKDFNLYTTISVATQILGTVFGMLLLRNVFKFSIVFICLISMGCYVLESTVRATACYWWEMYLGLSVGVLRGLYNPMLRAILTYVAPETEVGKIFAITTSLESLTPLGAAVLYANVYEATLNSYPGAFNFISVGLYGICFILITTTFAIQQYLGDTVVYDSLNNNGS